MGIECLDGCYDLYQGRVTIAAKLETIRAIFESKRCLDKARAMSSLSTGQLQKLFAGSAWKHCKNLLRIASKFRLQAHDGTHDQCSHCKVVCALNGKSFNYCVKVAKADQPEEQLRIAKQIALFG
jgi:hypothetical protein